MAPAGKERQTARGAAGQQRRGRLGAPSSARPRLKYRPGPAAAARGLQPHRGAASGAACVISARPSARGAQRTRVHFRPRPPEGSGRAGKSAEGGEHAHYNLDLWSLVLNLFPCCVSEMSLVRSVLALCGTFSYPLLTEEREENFKDVSKVKQPIEPPIISQKLFWEIGLMSQKHKNTRPPGIYVLAGEGDR